MNFAIFISLDHASIFQIDQLLLLQGAQLVQHLIRRVNSVKIKYDQIAYWTTNTNFR